MKQRWNTLRKNVGTGAAVRTLAVGCGFTVLACGSALSDADPRPLVTYVVALVLPLLARRFFIAHIAVTGRVLHLAALAIVAAAIGLGWARGRLWEAGTPEEQWLLPGVVFMVTAYVSSYFWTFSDPEVVRLEE